MTSLHSVRGGAYVSFLSLSSESKPGKGVCVSERVEHRPFSFYSRLLGPPGGLWRWKGASGEESFDLNLRKSFYCEQN